MLTVGRYLKKEREARGLSLDDVSHLTKISKFYLDYIEQDEFEKLPQGPYVKGYISSYSKLIGSNVDEALRLFDRAKQKEEPSEEDNPPPRLTVVDENFSQKAQAVHKTKQPVIDWKQLQSSLAATLTLMGKRFAAFVKKVDITNRARSWVAAVGSGTGRIIDKCKTMMKDSSSGLPSLAEKMGNFSRQTIFIYAGAILGIALLVFAGFGFYHLFVFDTPPAPAVEKQAAADSQKHISTADEKMMGANDPGETEKRIEDTPKSPSRTASRIEEKTTATPSPKRESPPSSVPVHPEKTSPRPAQAAAQNAPKLLKATVCSNIKDKNPADIGTIFPFSIGRIYIWTQVRAEKTPTTIRHIYYLEGERITDVALEVRSTFWRTWSYKTLDKDRYRGNWHVDIATSDGTVLRRLYFRVE